MPRAKELKAAGGGQPDLRGADASLESALGLLEYLPLPVFIKGRDGRYLAVNLAWEQFFGVPRDEFLGKKVSDLYPQSPEVAARHALMDAQLWAVPGGQSYEIPIVTADGA